MKKYYFTPIIFLLSAVTAPVIAQEDNPFYVGADMSLGNLDGVCMPSIKTLLVNENCDDNTQGYSIKVGYELNDSISIEGFYGFSTPAELKLKEYTANSKTYAATTADVDFDSLGMVIKGRYNMNNRFYVSGKIGFHNWETKHDITSDAHPRFAAAGAKLIADGTDLILGLGGSFDLHDQVVADVGYNIYYGETVDFKAINFGISYNF